MRGAARIKTINVKTGDRDDFLLRANQGVVLPVNESHAICFLEDVDFIMLKSRRFDAADPDTFTFSVSE